MALNLIKANHNVVAFDVVSDCIKPLTAAGAQVLIFFLHKFKIKKNLFVFFNLSNKKNFGISYFYRTKIFPSKNLEKFFTIV